MIKAILFIVRPAETWDGIARAARNFWFIFFVSLLPMLLLSIAGEVAGRHFFSKPLADGQVDDVFTRELAVRYAATRLAVELLAVLVCAWLLKAFSETFHDRHSLTHCFALAVYSLSPLFLFHLLDAIPDIYPWVSFLVGMIFALVALYYGIPCFLKPDPPHAFGLFLSGGMLLTLTNGLARLVAVMVLEKKIVPF